MRMGENNFWARYVSLCEKKGGSLTAPVMAVGMHRSAITSWRNGKMPSKTTLDKLAGYFGVTRQYLLDGEDAELGLQGFSNAPLGGDILTSSQGDLVQAGQDVRIKRFFESSNVDASSDPDIKKRLGSRPESRFFIEFALNLLQIYYPDKSPEVLIAELGMPELIIEKLGNPDVNTILVDRDWSDRFYSLFEQHSVLQLEYSLRKMAGILHSGWAKAGEPKINKAIQTHMFQNGVDEIECIEELPMGDLARYFGFYAVPYGMESCGWKFCFRNITRVAEERDTMLFLRESIKWFCKTPDVKHFSFMFVYTPRFGIDGNLADVEQFVTTTFRKELALLPPDSHFWFIQLQGETREIMASKLLELTPTEPGIQNNSDQT